MRQVVQVPAKVSLPITADPLWIPVLGVAARLSYHALMRAAQRGISKSMIENTLKHGVRTPGDSPGTSVFTRGSGKNRLRVVVNDKTGTTITVTK